ncbi:S9 family peptidase [Novosphingobium sp. KCTC 2891]|uniref:alpha/beta hydrolase family protein n=1 Tax=Novosphingobium sp. KCTC 2891 TaxID=2989730 RepID=UPI002223E2BF|nr:S9 family peptidase [Novosphingobium sp. KCTC 2891]MCW1382205.1 S9 family peptidase [Novosphingobium sp. KCTC 2891]
MKTSFLSRAALSLALAASFSAAPAQAQGVPQPFSAQDLVTLGRFGSLAVSPDGKLLAYTVTTTDPVSYARTTSLWLRPLGDARAAARQVAVDGAVSDPAFAPDGSLWFLSDGKQGGKDAGTQVWKIAAPAGAGALAVPVTAFKADVSGFKLSPDGKRLAVWGDIARDCPTFGGCASDGNTSQPGPGTGRLYKDSTGFVRHWDAWETPGNYSRVFAYALGTDGRVNTDTGRALDGDAANGGLVGDAPTKPFGDGAQVAWSADSSAVVYVARQADRDEPRSTNLDLWWAPVNGDAPRNLTAANKATDTAPALSPDGQWLAWTAMARPTYEADRLVVNLLNLRTGERRELTGGWDRSVDTLQWTPDGKALIATAEDVLDTPAFRIDPKSGKVVRLALSPAKGREGHIGNVTPLRDGRVVFTRDSIDAPAEIYVGKPGKGATRLTDIAASALAARAPVVTRRFSFAGANGDTVWGQITKPAGAAGKLPGILYVHGGPQGSFNDAWSNRWNPRVVASQGYAVVSVDFHGSTGYGQAFTDAINNDWGGKPLEDLQKGFAAAAAVDAQVDTDNACAMGASYGGYMMNWIEGNWADKFRCIVQHDGVFDARAMAYETEELWFDEWEHGQKTYFDAPEAYEKWNPVNHVAKWKTPMLVVTSEKDFRIPYTQGLAAFTALQTRKVPSELLVFPDENHWVLKPKNSLQWHQTVFRWLDRWLRKGGKEG